MILAAGRGSRMLHLTELTPKPLLNINGSRLIEHRSLALVEAGIKEIVINVHYHADKIIEYLGNGKKYGATLEYSFENECLGTGGGIKKALEYLGNKPFVLSSSDIYTDYPFANLTDIKTDSAHLVLVPNPTHHPEGDFNVNNGIISLQGNEKQTYAGMALFHPKIFKKVKLDSFPITTALFPAIDTQKVTAETYEGKWINVDNSDRLKQAEVS